MPIRVKGAATILGVSPGTVRNWCNQGKLPYHLSAANQRIFDKNELLEFKAAALGDEIAGKETVVFYIRSSNGNDVTMDTQEKKLREAYGEPDLVIKDKASGLNENRTGLKKLLTLIAENPEDSSKTIKVCVTNRDRLSRFGTGYIELFAPFHNTEIVVLDSDDTKEPHEVLLQDFMSLLASFSGKFYRLRGWEQQKKLIEKISMEVERREHKKGRRPV